ncbi:MAG: hypothetical protein IJC68_00110 [Firmicutes bacterium]|nr:hypothetical protein [Bacillota bacterium]
MKLDNLTQFFRPLETPIENVTSHYLYLWKNKKPWFLVIKTILLLMAITGFIGDVTDFISGTVTNRLLIAAGFLLPGILTLVEYTENYNNRFTSVESEPGVYDAVEPPSRDWVRMDLSTMNGKEPVFRSDKMDALLRSGKAIPLTRDKIYEKNLRRRIGEKETWTKIYLPFLQQNYRQAMYAGKQFYNEKKYGLSQPIDFAVPKAKVHKTCYFDTYLTNIIPGKVLTYNQMQTVAANAADPDFLPYYTDTEGKRHLYTLGETFTSNECGVTTLLIKPNDRICLWSQNRMAQCSTGLLVASGSGSADWNDCKKFIGDPDGLRKAVVTGMERELWEESNGTRANQKKAFLACVETRITGYFRWLKKGGKSEFVGLSRLTDRSFLGSLSPEVSEVTAGLDLQAESIAVLQKSIG